MNSHQTFRCLIAIAVLTAFLAPTGNTAVTWGPWNKTEVQGVFWRYQRIEFSSGEIHGYIHVANHTSEWVTVFVYSSQLSGTLSLNSLVAQGMLVEYTSVKALDKGAVCRIEGNSRFWVWAMKGQLCIRDRAIIPCNP